jgi:hypothetical protein
MPTNPRLLQNKMNDSTTNYDANIYDCWRFHNCQKNMVSGPRFERRNPPASDAALPTRPRRSVISFQCTLGHERYRPTTDFLSPFEYIKHRFKGCFVCDAPHKKCPMPFENTQYKSVVNKSHAPSRHGNYILYDVA